MVLSEEDWVALCAALGMTPKADVKTLIEIVGNLKHEIRYANEKLAPYCGEVDPGRCPLRDTVDMLIDEVLKPLS